MRETTRHDRCSPRSSKKAPRSVSGSSPAGVQWCRARARPPLKEAESPGLAVGVCYRTWCGIRPPADAVDGADRLNPACAQPYPTVAGGPVASPPHDRIHTRRRRAGVVIRARRPKSLSGNIAALACGTGSRCRAQSTGRPPVTATRAPRCNSPRRGPAAPRRGELHRLPGASGWHVLPERFHAFRGHGRGDRRVPYRSRRYGRHEYLCRPIRRPSARWRSPSCRPADRCPSNCRPRSRKRVSSGPVRPGRSVAVPERPRSLLLSAQDRSVGRAGGAFGSSRRRRRRRWAVESRAVRRRGCFACG